MARDGRRRRVLNDEARSASGINLHTTAAEADPNAPRYGEQAGVEHHPQVTDFVPRRKRAVLATLALGIGTAAVASALAHFAPEAAKVVPGVTAADLGERLAGGLVAWTSAIAMLTAAALAKIIYSLRRHRVDDYRGRYRVWRWAVWGAMFTSLNAVAGLHVLAAKTAAAATGWSLTAGGAEWWLAAAALAGGWILVRLVIDVAESRTAMMLLISGMACYVVGAAGALGWTLPGLAGAGAAVIAALPLSGHTLVLAALMVYGRYVVLDVQGLIDHAPRPAKKSARQARYTAEPAEDKSTPAAAPAESWHTPAADSRKAGRETEWADESDSDEDAGETRKLSKADRKRLRKQNRAA